MPGGGSSSSRRTGTRSSRRWTVLAVIKDLAAQGWTLVVTHEIRFAEHVADQVLFLDGGVTGRFLKRILDPS